MMWYDFALRTAAALTLWALIGPALNSQAPAGPGA